MSSGGMNAGFDMNQISAISRPDPEEIFIISTRAQKKRRRKSKGGYRPKGANTNSNFVF